MISRNLRQFLKRLVFPPPRGIAFYGSGARLERPCRIDGARGIHIGARSWICKHSWLDGVERYAGESFTPQLYIGEDVYIGHYACIAFAHNVTISNGCVLSEHVYITDHAHGLDPGGGLIMQQRLVSKGTVHIGKHSFIGYRACILSGVHLGEHCVVGANSVVTHSFPAFSMVAGAPARLIRRYAHEQRAWVNVESGEHDHSR